MAEKINKDRVEELVKTTNLLKVKDNTAIVTNDFKDGKTKKEYKKNQVLEIVDNSKTSKDKSEDK